MVGKKGDLPANQMVNIVVNSFSTLRDGSIAITADLAADQEVDYAVDQLIKDLGVVRKKAKEKIKKTNEKIRASLKDK
jgi:hypothetical protein